MDPHVLFCADSGAPSLKHPRAGNQEFFGFTEHDLAGNFVAVIGAISSVPLAMIYPALFHYKICRTSVRCLDSKRLLADNQVATWQGNRLERGTGKLKEVLHLLRLGGRFETILFFLLREGEGGVRGARRGGRGHFLLKILPGGGGFQEGEGPRGRGECLQRIGKCWGGGLHIFFFGAEMSTK